MANNEELCEIFTVEFRIGNINASLFKQIFSSTHNKYRCIYFKNPPLPLMRAGSASGKTTQTNHN